MSTTACRVRACRSLAAVNVLPREIAGNRWIRQTYTAGSRVHGIRIFARGPLERNVKRRERWTSAFYTSSFTADRKAREESCRFSIACLHAVQPFGLLRLTGRRTCFFFCPCSAVLPKLFLDVMKTENKLGLLYLFPSPAPTIVIQQYYNYYRCTNILIPRPSDRFD